MSENKLYETHTVWTKFEDLEIGGLVPVYPYPRSVIMAVLDIDEKEFQHTFSPVFLSTVAPEEP